MSKLVRDKIVGIIENEGRSPKYLLLDDDAYTEALFTKMEEELGEVRRAIKNNEKLEELADLQEVMDSLIKVLGFTKGEVRKAQRRKRIKCGGFKEHILLIDGGNK